jgi:hypothetical protein
VDVSPQTAEENLRQLARKRQELEKDLDAIDQVFERFGVDPERVIQEEPRPEVQHRKTRVKRSGRKFVLDYLQRHPGASTREITQAWRRAGRTGRPDQPLYELVKEGSIQRKKAAQGSGSQYHLVA